MVVRARQRTGAATEGPVAPGLKLGPDTPGPELGPDTPGLELGPDVPGPELDPGGFEGGCVCRPEGSGGGEVEEEVGEVGRVYSWVCRR